jgi:hypothetical protein
MVAYAAFGIAAVVACWPMLSAAWVRWRPVAAAAGVDRADWVNRLFGLAAAADEAGEPVVASAARALITALVTPQEPAKRGK